MGGFCDKLEKPFKPRKKVSYFPKKAKYARRRERGTHESDTMLKIRHYGAYGLECEYPLFLDHRKVSLSQNYSYIVDTSGLIQNEWNPVEHIKYDGLIALQPHTVKMGSVEVLVVPEDLAFNIFDEVHANIPIPDDNTMDDLAAMSINHFRNAVDNTGESLANFFIELAQSCEGNIKALKKYSTLWKKCEALYNRAYERYLKQGHNSAASGWLAWNFAIKTNISDLKRLLCSFHRARLRFEWLKQRNLKPTKVKYRKLECFQPPDSFVINGVAPTRTWVSDLTTPCALPGSAFAVDYVSYLELTKVNYELTYCAEGFVIFSIPEWVFESTGKGQAIVWAAQEGFTNPLKIAWNSIPYTWLLDWFVSYRTHLQEQSADLSPLKDAAIIHSAHSFKLTSTWLVEHVYEDDEGQHREPLGTVNYDSYVRKIGLPISSENPFRVPWSGYNISIVVALVIQWWRRRH